MSGLSSSQRISGVGGVSSSSGSGFADAWAGVNIQLKKDDDTPAVLAFAEVALQEKHRVSSASFKSAVLGATTYKAIDPVVFSLTGAYRFNLFPAVEGSESLPKLDWAPLSTDMQESPNG